MDEMMSVKVFNTALKSRSCYFSLISRVAWTYFDACRKELGDREAVKTDEMDE